MREPSRRGGGLSAVAFYLLLPVVAALVLLPLVAGDDWFGDMITFFRPHVAGLALLLLVLAALPPRPAKLALALPVLIAALVPIVLPRAPTATARAPGDLRVLTANVLVNNSDFDRLPAEIAALSPDIVVVQEALYGWPDVMQKLPGYPHVAGPDIARWNGIIVASRFPLRATIMDEVPDVDHHIGGSRAIRVEVDRPGITRPLVLYGLHAPTPRTRAGWEVRNAYLARLAERIRAEAAGTDVIVAGDWNTPIWSPTYARFLADAGLKATERSVLPQPTRIFREFGAPRFLGATVDHIAVSADIGVAALDVGADFGSDHLPVIADLSLPVTTTAHSGQPEAVHAE